MATRRGLGRWLLAGAVLPGFGPALAQPGSGARWSPSRPVALVVPYPAGGGADALARLVATELSRDLGQPVVVENLGGGGGSIGTRRVAGGPADGTMLLLGTNQTHATNLSLLPDGGGYDPVRDFAPVAGMTDLQHLLVVRPQMPAESVEALLALARSRSAGLSCGSTGPGSGSHLALELFRLRTGGPPLVHVPYRGAAPLLSDLLGGHVDLSFATVPTVIQQVRAGQLRALAAASPRRAPELPEVPTLAEAGVAGVEADAWFALFAPAGVPEEALSRLEAAVLAALGREALREQAARLGMAVNPRGRPALRAYLGEEIGRWAELIRVAGVRAE